MSTDGTQELEALETLDLEYAAHHQQGFPITTKPTLPAPTEELDAVLSQGAASIEEEFIKNQAWATFTNSELARCNGALAQIGNQRLFWQHTLSKQFREKHDWSLEEFKAALWTDSLYLDLVRRETGLVQRKQALAADLARFKGNIAVISRLVTVRGQDVLLQAPAPRRRGARK